MKGSTKIMKILINEWDEMDESQKADYLTDLVYTYTEEASPHLNNLHEFRRFLSTNVSIKRFEQIWGLVNFEYMFSKHKKKSTKPKLPYEQGEDTFLSSISKLRQQKLKEMGFSSYVDRMNENEALESFRYHENPKKGSSMPHAEALYEIMTQLGIDKRLNRMSVGQTLAYHVAGGKYLFSRDASGSFIIQNAETGDTVVGPAAVGLKTVDTGLQLSPDGDLTFKVATASNPTWTATPDDVLSVDGTGMVILDLEGNDEEDMGSAEDEEVEETIIEEDEPTEDWEEDDEDTPSKPEKHQEMADLEAHLMWGNTSSSDSEEATRF